MYSASGGELFGNVSTAVAALAGATRSCAVVSTPVSVFDDESPTKGLNKAIGGGVGRLFVGTSEDDDEKDN